MSTKNDICFDDLIEFKTYINNLVDEYQHNRQNNKTLNEIKSDTKILKMLMSYTSRIKKMCAFESDSDDYESDGIGNEYIGPDGYQNKND
ncbi:putative ORFan [Tupanvirus deep ocean]|uniref:ORFan n=2 Tax=Tupanvirus TaxID=2094720 RepID=A0AC62A6X0_9VIRU|nr:putative ORFan [Tupanvirus deep ocean]QKU33521.1 putative ORFan [Tupanvirus deep ocean]